MLRSLLKPNRIKVPRDLAAATHRDERAEIDPAAVDLTRGQIDAIWRSIEALYRSGLHPAISLCVRRRGQIVIRRSLGHAVLPGEHDPGRPCTPDTPICLFSASKAVTAMLIHKLAEMRKLGIDDAIVDYLPDFAAHGKGSTTIRHLLAHRAGIPRVPAGLPPQTVFDWNEVIRQLSAARPSHSSGDVQSYHAITGGFILGEIAQRVTGRALPELLREFISAPMGFRYMSYGLPPRLRSEAAKNYATGPKSWFPLTRYIENVLGAPFEKVVEISNRPEYLDAVIPAGNIYATADEAGAFFQMLMQGGRWNDSQLFKPETIAEAIRPVGPIHIDRTLFAPVRFSSGFVLGEWPLGLYGRNCRSAYGHLGFMSSICWADPARELSVGFVNTGKSLSADQVKPLVGVLKTISEQCPPVRVKRSLPT